MAEKGLRCAKEGCKGRAMRDGSGFCQAHNPAKAEARREHMRKISSLGGHKKGSVGNCAFEGCRGWAMKDGSGFCRHHNPNLEQERIKIGWKISKSKRINKPPADRRCKVKSCNSWSMLDGSGLCWTHKPETMSRRKTWLKGKKFEKGHHRPWLGLGSYEEAVGLLRYSLVSDKPELSLKALTKIASLHANGTIKAMQEFYASEHLKSDEEEE